MAERRRGEWTRTLIKRQADAWEAAASAAGSLPDGPVLLTGSGSSYYAALTAAAIGERLGLSVAARPAADIVTEPAVALAGIRTLVVVSRSGHTTEAVWAAEAAAVRGVFLVAATCHPERELAARAHAVWAVPSAEDDTVVMLRSFTSLLVLLQAAVARAAGMADPPLAALLRAWPAWHEAVTHWLEEPRDVAPRRAVVLGGGVRWGIALEGMLKATEMSNQVAQAYVPLEYRHGPWGSLTDEDIVLVLTQRGTAQHDRQLVADLTRRTPHVVVIGPEGGEGANQAPGAPMVRRITYPLAVDDLWAGPLVVVPLQAFSWWWAMASGQNPDDPQNLEAVVKLDA
ncbi:MAG: SIS domain-containing protein [Thermaerobacter sp.]|nr:SIS domain-containing protein [Thermaerobacter sp.]